MNTLTDGAEEHTASDDLGDCYKSGDCSSETYYGGVVTSIGTPVWHFSHVVKPWRLTTCETPESVWPWKFGPRPRHSFLMLVKCPCSFVDRKKFNVVTESCFFDIPERVDARWTSAASRIITSFNCSSSNRGMKTESSEASWQSRAKPHGWAKAQWLNLF